MYTQRAGKIRPLESLAIPQPVIMSGIENFAKSLELNAVNAPINAGKS